LSALVVAWGCGVNGTESPDRILVGGSVWTGDVDAPTAEALAIAGQRIIAVGGSDEIRALAGPETDVIELGGRFAMPGFIDTHTHFLDGGLRLASVDLRDAATPDEFVRRLAEHAEQLPAGTWILGGDWDHEMWGGELPDREWIDAVTTEHPVFVTRLDWHMALANSRALELAGFDPKTPDPAGGQIVRDGTGRPTGVFKDKAMEYLSEAIPQPTAVEQDSALSAAMRFAASLGVTGIHDMGTWDGLAAYERAHRRGALTLRVRVFVPLSTVERLATFVDERGGTGDDMLSWGGLKGFVDGSLGSSTALFFDPYLDSPATSGLTVIRMDALADRVRIADSAGLQVAIHAIGDRANAELLDLYQNLVGEHGERDRRYRIEHAQHLRPEDFGRFAELGVIPAMQPYHAIDDGRWAERKIGPERARSTYAFRSLEDAGARPAFGSDWTVGPLDPLLGVFAAVTRRTLDGAHPDGWIPEQRITLGEALRAYTSDAASAGFIDDRVGILKPGMLADIVVLDRSPFDVDPSVIRDLEVELTLVGGEIVFDPGR
jgi:predicted amidohydrolase YtcJ